MILENQSSVSIPFRPRGSAGLKTLKKQLGVSKKEDLLALAPNNDPFNYDTEAKKRDAEWFAERWQASGFTEQTGVHLRKLHYRLVAKGENTVPLPRSVTFEDENGEKGSTDFYANYDAVWNYLAAAGAQARYWGLVPPEAFVDRRNPPPTLNARPFWTQAPEWAAQDCPRWTVPTIRAELEPMDWRIPGVDLSGYDYDSGCQPYLIEVWCEKSTIDDVLEPLCRRFGANYITAKGFQSITAALNILDRAKAAGKPARIFFISDFDPAGDQMPVATARQIEFWFEQFDPGVEVKVEALALTIEQVQEHDLPPGPIKPTDKRAKKFLERYGLKGAVEVDALADEVLKPGVLKRLVETALKPYRDPDLYDRLWDAEQEAKARCVAALAPIREQAREDLERIESAVQEIWSGYQGRLETLAQDLAQDLAPMQKELDVLRYWVGLQFDDLEIELPERPEAEIDPPDESRWLFDSNRDYVEQLGHYQARRNGAADEEVGQ